MLGSSATLLGSPVEVGLSTTTPNDDGTNITEPPGGAAYARVSLANTNGNFPVASGGEKSNGVDVEFPEATAGWGTVTHWVLYDASVPKIWGIIDDGAGTPLSRDILTGDVFKFPSTRLRMTLD